MANIMQCIIGRDFGGSSWWINFSSPFAMFSWSFNEIVVPFPAKNFDCQEVEAFRNYLTSIIEDYKSIANELEELNV